MELVGNFTFEMNGAKVYGMFHEVEDNVDTYVVKLYVIDRVVLTNDFFVDEGLTLLALLHYDVINVEKCVEKRAIHIVHLACFLRYDMQYRCGLEDVCAIAREY